MRAVEGRTRAGVYPSDPQTPSGPLSRATDGALLADLRRACADADPLPDVVVEAARVAARPAGGDDFDCSVYPEGDGRHDYRITASSFYGVGLDHPDYRRGETCYRCRRCGDVFVARDSEMEALDEGCPDA